ncbi:hypothetical protein BMS3Abin04_03153 [bacterium BMS3Abin04]|nr:hypothetical protein BMS3Abin04_03153 [bacterium BMS3Abin04]
MPIESSLIITFAPTKGTLFLSVTVPLTLNDCAMGEVNETDNRMHIPNIIFRSFMIYLPPGGCGGGLLKSQIISIFSKKLFSGIISLAGVSVLVL